MDIYGIVEIAGLLAVLAITWRWHRHDQEHCHQIGQLQHVVAELGAHLRGMTADPLPDDVTVFVDEILRHEATHGRD